MPEQPTTGIWCGGFLFASRVMYPFEQTPPKNT